MGEVAMSSSEEVVLEEIVKEEKEQGKVGKFSVKEESSRVVRWDDFVPRVFLRVLLVEGDDSTREIISALLKKCNYRVAAVSDGLKAWEMLKKSPPHVDLILTEVQLPSISGFALLTLIMGHETCKRIPVIMMSSHHSVSIVFKCMMKGAVDFLVKPVRKNELRNLWQHVWRRQTLSTEQGHQNGNPIKGQVGGMSNHSDDCMASEKDSVAQSSCTKPGMEAETASMISMLDLLQPKCGSSLAMNVTENKCKDHAKSGGDAMSDGAPNRQMFHLSATVSHNQGQAGKMSGDKVMELASYKDDSSMVNKTDDSLGLRAEPSRKAIDLIGMVGNQVQFSFLRADNTTGRGDLAVYANNVSDNKKCSRELSFVPQLELSLRRFEPNGNEVAVQKQPLNHSNASAFSWYNNKMAQHASIPTCGSNSLEQGLENMDTIRFHEVAQDKIEEFKSPVSDPSRIEIKVLSSHSRGTTPVPIPFNGMSLHGLHEGYSTSLQPLFYAHPTAAPGPPPPPPPWSSDSMSTNRTYHSESQNEGPECDRHPSDHNANRSSYQFETTHNTNLESRADPNHTLSAPGQSGNSSLCNDSGGNQKSSGCGSVCNGTDKNFNATAVASAVTESWNSEHVFTSDRDKPVDCQRISQREAALTKFRLKRKDRCFEKKVRYHSRKRLAEQRPRVKGQFVRQKDSKT